MGSLELIRMWEPIEPPAARAAWTFFDHIPISEVPVIAQGRTIGPPRRDGHKATPIFPCPLEPRG